jgi:hypothetical protein
VNFFNIILTKLILYYYDKLHLELHTPPQSIYFVNAKKPYGTGGEGSFKTQGSGVKGSDP